MNQPPPQQSGSNILVSDNDKKLDNQMLLVKQIRAILGTEMTKLEMMKKQLQLENINNIEIMEQQKLRKQQQDTENINLADMMMDKQQHQTGNINKTERMNLEMMKREQYEAGNINRMMMMEKQK